MMIKRFAHTISGRLALAIMSAEGKDAGQRLLNSRAC
jgi:hypothetical protein